MHGHFGDKAIQSVAIEANEGTAAGSKDDNEDFADRDSQWNRKQYVSSGKIDGSKHDHEIWDGGDRSEFGQLFGH